MKKNRIFPAMLGLSLALHGLVFFGWAWSNPAAPLPKPEDQPLTKVKLIRIAKTPPRSVPAPAPVFVPVPVQRREQRVVEKKPVEKPPEPVLQQEKTEIVAEVQAEDEHITQEPVVQEDAEIAAETQTGNEYIAQEITDGERETMALLKYSETDANREYDELLAYIRGLIRHNLLYPQIARRRNIEGVVGVQFEIGTDGGLVFAKVDRSSGSSILDKAAVSLIEKICPIKSGAIKKSMTLHINITYELTK